MDGVCETICFSIHCNNVDCTFFLFLLNQMYNKINLKTFFVGRILISLRLMV